MVAELWPSIEQSAIGVAMRSSPFLYPAANVAHILGLMLFFSAVAVMDAKVLGVFPHVPAGCVLRTGRPLAVGGFLVQRRADPYCSRRMRWRSPAIRLSA